MQHSLLSPLLLAALAAPSPVSAALAQQSPFRLPTKDESLPAPLVTHDAERAAHAFPANAGLGQRPRVLHVDQPGDGAIWAAGTTYKARFDVRGASVIPFFGAEAPRNFPVSFEVRSITLGGAPLAFDAAASPVLEGNRIVYDRGFVREVYDLSLDSLEQSFVFDELPGSGELAVHLGIESELARGEQDGALVLRNEHGALGYSHALSFDARGVKEPAPTRWNEGEIEIRVPAARVAARQGALVIDPLISVFDVAASTEDEHDPDVAYDPSQQRWGVVYEWTFSATDTDVYISYFESDGAFVFEKVIDLTTDNWRSSSIADNALAQHFLVASQVGDVSGANNIIRGRMINGGGVSLAQFTIADGNTGTETEPDVGGDPSPNGPTYFCVAWMHKDPGVDSDIQAQVLTVLGAPVLPNPITLSGGSYSDLNVAVSKTNGPAPANLQDWNIAWTSIDPVDQGDIWAARIHWNGALTSAPFLIDGSDGSSDEASVTCVNDSTPPRWLVTYNYKALNWVKRSLEFDLVEGTTVVDARILEGMTSQVAGTDSSSSDADCDGSTFHVAYAFTNSGNFEVGFTALKDVGGAINPSELHVPLAFSATHLDRAAKLACEGAAGGPGHSSLSVWERSDDPQDEDVLGALYESNAFVQFCEPGPSDVLPCPCGNGGGKLAGCNNSADTGGGLLSATGGIAPDNVQLHATQMRPSSVCIFLQGSALIATGTAFGDGVRCAGGQLLRLATKSNVTGAANYPVFGDITISARNAQLGFPIPQGAKRYYQTYYRDPDSGFACLGLSTYNITNAVRVEW